MFLMLKCGSTDIHELISQLDRTSLGWLIGENLPLFLETAILLTAFCRTELDSAVSSF